MVPLPHRRTSAALTVAWRRALDGLLTAWAAVTLAFFALRLTAGDPVASLLSRGLATTEQAEALRRSLGLDLSLPAQYWRFLRGIPGGDWGVSLQTAQPVWEMILDQLAPTVRLAMAGLGVAIVLGLVLGVIGAWRSRSLAGRLAPALASLATALPVATTGVLVLVFFGLALRVTQGSAVMVALTRSVLPALVLGYAASGPIARAIHAGLRESMQAQYLLAAKARGLAEGTRLLWHALRPALPPAISLIALEAAFLFSGTVVTETVFARPGLGRLLIRSILQGDYPLAQAIVALAAMFYVASQVAADLISIALDPRMRRAL